MGSLPSRLYYNGKKLVNPLDSLVRSLQLEPHMCFLEYIGLVYNKYTFDKHGLRQEDIHRVDCQNWTSAQYLCQVKVRQCLADLHCSGDTHQEWILRTEMYLQICANYFDIFLSRTLDL